MNLAIITSKERKKERNLRKELEYRDMEATKDLDMMLLKHKEIVRELGRRHKEERREMEKALQRKQVEELDEMNLANEQERLAMMKKIPKWDKHNKHAAQLVKTVPGEGE